MCFPGNWQRAPKRAPISRHAEEANEALDALAFLTQQIDYASDEDEVDVRKGKILSTLQESFTSERHDFGSDLAFDMDFDMPADLAALASLMGDDDMEEDLSPRPIKVVKTIPTTHDMAASQPEANLLACPLLREMILRDLDRNGQRLLPVYLTTNDLLRLSECCRATVSNRYLLKSMKLIKHPDDAAESTCTSLLLQQAHLTHLYVEDASCLGAVMEALKKGNGHNLVCLDMSKFTIPNFKLSQLAILLAKQACQNLRELGIRMGADDMGLLTVLAQGTCPELRRLVLHVTNAKKVLMSEYFHSKYCTNLTEVELQGAQMTEVEALALLRQGQVTQSLPKLSIQLGL